MRGMPECTAELQVSFYHKRTLCWQAETALTVVCTARSLLVVYCNRSQLVTLVSSGVCF